MKVWAKKLVPMAFAFAGVLFIFVGVVKPVIKGQPLDGALLSVGLLALVLGIATRRKSGDNSGPPSA